MRAMMLPLGAAILGNFCEAFPSIQFTGRAAARNKTFITTNPTALSSLKKAGDSFASLSKSLDEPAASSFQSAGDALLQAHDSWTADWTEVTMALADAATSFSRISDQFSERNIVASDLYQKIAQELEDVSHISGCASSGPPSSAPNMEAIRDYLLELSELKEMDIHSPTASAYLLEAFKGVTSLVESID
jgi:hypothetical protein